MNDEFCGFLAEVLVWGTGSFIFGWLVSVPFSLIGNAIGKGN
tara:strand:+ start:67 stop:192 length:126 start_codon:yes stop_codon:yes gene_type:complete